MEKLITNYRSARNVLISAVLEVACQLGDNKELCAALATLHGYTANAVSHALKRNDADRVTITDGSKWILEDKQPRVCLSLLVFLTGKSRWHNLEIPFDALTDEADRATWIAGYLARAKKCNDERAGRMFAELARAKKAVARLPIEYRTKPAKAK